jgi:hypothetical protein
VSRRVAVMIRSDGICVGWLGIACDERDVRGSRRCCLLTAMSSDLNPATPTGPTTLRSLRQYASRQTALIDSLSNVSPENPVLWDTGNRCWVQFYKSAWGAGEGNPDSLDKRGDVASPSPEIRDLILPDVVPNKQDEMLKPEHLDTCWPFRCEKFLVRSEYKETEEFVLSTCVDGFGAVVVTGRPGIGLSLFYSDYGILESFTREICLSTPSLIAASRTKTPHRTANRP